MTEFCADNLICPKCKKTLIKLGNSLKCTEGHCYDISNKGYVNLLIHKGTVLPGDNQEMVSARRTAMQNGYYNILSLALVYAINKYSPSVLLDIGCGEGSLTRGFTKIADKVYGMDISKNAIARASANDKLSTYFVASISNIPIQDKSVDVIINCFAPLDTKEAKRVLKNDGVLIKVVPDKRHLFELKQAIYPKPYENEPFKPLCDFVLDETKRISTSVTASGDYLDSIVKMTPYYYKTPKEYLSNVVGKTIECSLEFLICVYKIK